MQSRSNASLQMKTRFRSFHLSVSLACVAFEPLLQGQCVWKGKEDEVGTIFEWTWTRRGASNDYDEVRRNTKTGKVQNFVVRQFEKRPDRSVVFGRVDFVGRHRGTVSADGRSAKGFLDWTGGPWSAEITGCGLGIPEPPPPVQTSAIPGGVAPGVKWTVVERSGNDRYESVWTVLPDGKSFHVTWKRLPSGQSGVIDRMGWIESVSGNRIVIERPGLGRYTGTIDTARGTITGKPSWSEYIWEVTLPGGTRAAEPPPPRPAIAGIAPGAKWSVVESSGNDRYESVWTVLPDGKSFHMTWKRIPGGQSGVIDRMGWIESINGNQIVIERPGLGRYTGTIDAARGTITGKPGWSDYKWEVNLTGGPAGAAKPPEILVDTAEDMGTGPVFRTLLFGPFGMKVESAWKETNAQRTLTLTGPAAAKIRFEEQGTPYKSQPERARILARWKTPQPGGPIQLAGGKLGQIAAECVRREQPKTKSTQVECYADSGDAVHKITVETAGLVKQMPPPVMAVLDTLRWMNSKAIKKYEGAHPIEKAISRLPKQPALAQEGDVLWTPAPPGYTLPSGGAGDLGMPDSRPRPLATPAQYAAAAAMAMNGMRELTGPMTPEQEQKFAKKWSSFLQEPSPVAAKSLETLTPLIEETLAVRETAANAAAAFDRSWADAVAAAVVEDEEAAATALAAAYQSRQLLLAAQGRLNRILEKAEKQGNPPDLQAARAAERAKALGARTAPPTQVTQTGAAPAAAPGRELAGVWINDKITHGIFPLRDGSYGEIECVAPEMGCSVMRWTLRQAAPGVYKPSQEDFTIQFNGGVLRWQLTKDWPAYKGEFTKADLFNPPMPYNPATVEAMRKADQERQRRGAALAAAPDDEGRWPCAPANFNCMAEMNSIRKYTAMYVARMIVNPPVSLEAAQRYAVVKMADPTPAQVAAALGGAVVPAAPAPASPSASLPPMGEKERAEAITEHNTWIQAMEKNLAKDRADLARAKTPQEKDLLQWRVINAEANIQAERDLVRSLETGTYVHTRTKMDDLLHAQMIDNSREYNARVDQTRRMAEGLMRLAGTADSPEQAQQVRDFVARQLSPADIAAGNLEKARQAAKAVLGLVQGGNLAAGAQAQEQAETADDLLRYAQGTKVAASVALSMLAPAAIAELGFGAAADTLLTYGFGVAYGGVTGYVEGGPAQAIREAVAQASLAGAVAVEAFDGYQTGGAGGAAQNAALTFLGGKLVEYGASKAAKAYAVARSGLSPSKVPTLTISELCTNAVVIHERNQAERLIGAFKTATGEQRLRLAAEINSNYMAKLMIKQGGAAGAGRPLETDATSVIREMYRTRVDPAFRSSVQKSGIRWQERGPNGEWRDAAPVDFREFRQGGKRETFNMDRDFGLIERDPSRFRLVQGDNGKPINLHQAQERMQELYEQAYRAAMFGQDPKRAFQNITTSMSGDAYRQWGFTRLMNPEQPNIWRDPWAQQAADVARDKVISIDKSSMPAALRLIEQARTAAKEIEQRLLTQLQRAKADPARIEYWQRVRQSLNTMVNDPVSGQRSLRLTSGEDSLRAVIDRVATAIEGVNKVSR